MPSEAVREPEQGHVCDGCDEWQPDYCFVDEETGLCENCLDDHYLEFRSDVQEGNSG